MVARIQVVCDPLFKSSFSLFFKYCDRYIMDCLCWQYRTVSFSYCYITNLKNNDQLNRTSRVSMQKCGSMCMWLCFYIICQNVSLCVSSCVVCFYLQHLQWHSHFMPTVHMAELKVSLLQRQTSICPERSLDTSGAFCLCSGGV